MVDTSYDGVAPPEIAGGYSFMATAFGFPWWRFVVSDDGVIPPGMTP